MENRESHNIKLLFDKVRSHNIELHLGLGRDLPIGMGEGDHAMSVISPAQ